MERVASLCRVCYNYCPIIVDVVEGRAVKVSGDPANDVYRGHSCAKGRAQHLRLYSPDRLLRSQKRMTDGRYCPIPVDDAIAEIGERLSRILDEFGSNALALYTGTYTIAHATMAPLATAFLAAAGSRLHFTPNTIDKPGKLLARALQGQWLAPPYNFDDPDAALLIGINPFVSYVGAPFGNPTYLKDNVQRGMTLIVIDPRRTEVARRASIYLQPKPGYDVAIVAAMLNVILHEGRFDHAFVDENVTGLKELEQAVEPFAPEAVARIADIDSEKLVLAARAFGDARRGYAIAGTGPSMSGNGTLLEYLVLNLDTLGGHWYRAGDVVRNPPVLSPAPVYKAQASPPRPTRGYGLKFRVRGLEETPTGLPTSAVADEILLEGPGQIRALISCAGNPVGAWPDQRRVVEAMKKLDLLVQIDPWMSETAKLAHYVIAPKMNLEVPGMTTTMDFLTNYCVGYGPLDSYGQYTPAIIDPPGDSDLIEEWEFFYKLAKVLGLTPSIRYRGSQVSLDMERQPTTDDLMEMLTSGSRIPLDEVMKWRHGARFPEPAVVVQPKDPDWSGRLDVGSAEMLEYLASYARDIFGEQVFHDGGFPYRVICRRSHEMMNTWVNDGNTTAGRTYNPAFMHPDDLEILGAEPGDLVEIESAHASILAVAGADASLRRGIVSITHGYGGVDELDPRQSGSNVNHLTNVDDHYDQYSGQPLMSNIPVRVRVPHS